jgi:threonine dehydrogenase-like Zn-dependent dehydrogenase
MRALVFRYSPPRLALTRATGALTPAAYVSAVAPLRLERVPEPTARPGWAIVRTGLACICGGDVT